MVSAETLLAVLTYFIALLGAVPVFLHLDLTAQAVLAVSFVSGLICDYRKRHFMKGLLPTAISILFFLYYAAGFSGENLIIPVLNLFSILLSVRLLSEKNGRNGLQIMTLSLFALAGSSILNLSMAFLVYLAFFMAAIAVYLVFLTFHSFGNRNGFSWTEVRKIAAVALAMPVLSVPLMAVFFPIMPRTQFPLWNFLNAPVQSVSGFSERVEPGIATAVNEVKKVVFRVESPELAPSDLYWRGIVLNDFEGNAWVRSQGQLMERSRPGKGKLISQTFYPEPSMNRYLVTLNLPLDIQASRITSSPDSVFVRNDSGRKRIRYRTVSILTDSIATDGRIDRELYLRLPSELSGRVRALANEISARGGTSQERLGLLEEYFREGGFNYSTSNLPSSSDPMDEFLFSKRSGNCEFFAGSFAILLRAMGVPSRLVGGYQGGEYNDLGGYYVVTEDRAHVWVEVSPDGRNWLTVDPTRFSANFAGFETDMAAKRLSRLQLLADSLGYYWSQGVVSYDLERQLQLLKKSGEAFQGINLFRNPRHLLFLAMPPLIFLLGLILRRKCRYVSREEKLLQKFLKKIRKKYPSIPLGPGTGLWDVARMTDAPSVRRFAELYGNVVYRDRKLSDNEYRDLARLAEKL